MTDDVERDKLAAQLAALPMRELLDVLRRVLPAQTDEMGSGLGHALVLAEATWSKDDANPASRADLELALIAWPDRAYYDHEPLGPDQGLYEEATCSGCAVNVTSTAKRAICPVCATTCYLT